MIQDTMLKILKLYCVKNNNFQLPTGRSAAFLSEEGIPRFFADQSARLYNTSLVSKVKVHTHYFRLRAEESKQACAQHHNWTQLVLWRTPCPCMPKFLQQLSSQSRLLLPTCRCARPSWALAEAPSSWIGEKERGWTGLLTSLSRRAVLVKMRSVW